MKITDIKTYIVSQKLGEKSFCYSQAWYNTRTIMILEIITDDGLSGWGEAFGNAFINQAVVEHAYKSQLIGQNVFDTEKIWDQLYNSLRDNGQKGSSIEALSAVDIALWDLKGKYTHLPVYTLMGGARRKQIIPYATGLYHTSLNQDPNALVAEAVSYVQSGFRALKMKIGFGVENDIKMVSAVREAIGPEIDLMVDPNHAYNACSAIKMAKGIEPYNILWIEEPVPPEDIQGYLEVKSATSISISGGEAEFTAYGFKNLIDARAIDILQPDCCITGGLTAFNRIVTLAKIANIQCYPHVWGSGIAVAAGLHASFSMPDFPEALVASKVYFELDRTENIFREKINKNPLVIRDGYIDLPQSTEGLGIEIDRDLIKKYQIG
ncbi:MAG: mandelate racemase/muconate lactonizing enzyme family protein [Sphaerochaeta sp.]|nr:mandelate racemase/muconate lactonizing enzyme family protein [Sphaerochaeta sp.]